MNGKEKCEMLRSIRMNIAQKYGIEYEPKECEHEECSTGTCPLCDKEAEFILEELRKRNKAGELENIEPPKFNASDLVSDDYDSAFNNNCFSGWSKYPGSKKCAKVLTILEITHFCPNKFLRLGW